MGYSQRSAHISLKDWEDWLAPQVRQVELLGEIPITANECAQLGKAIGLRVKGLGHARALGLLEETYPCALAVYLVAQGIYGYQGGDYWGEVIEVTHLSHAYTWQVGQAFEAILEAMGLPLFYDMRAEKARRYVSLILAHGGIPNYCLPDFFKNMLQPSVLKIQYADLSAAELIDEWAWHSSTHYFTDKPVLRFLLYGDRVAEDFVERCREMAREYLDSGLMPDGEQVGLPERVVEAYRQWIVEQGAEQIERETGDRWRLRKPEILVDPWGEGVLVSLPPQQAPATEIHADVAWQVTAGDKTQRVPVRLRRTGFDWKTTEESLPLRQPAATYQVALLVNGQAQNTWLFQGIDDKHPLLVWNAQGGALLKQSFSLPARPLDLLYPAEWDLAVEGEAHLVEEWPQLLWGWASFRGQTWDLGRASRISLKKGGQEMLTVVLRPDEAKQQPTLQGGTLIAPEKPGARAPVYEGSPPSVRIPLSERRNVDEELARWRVTVQNKWAALPRVKRVGTLADLRPLCIEGNGYVDLPLRHPSLLGEKPFGSYLVRLRGPLGRGAEFTLRIVPHLTIVGHEELYLPDAQGGPTPATLLIETLPGCHLEGEGVDGKCIVQPTSLDGDRWEYRLEAAPDVTGVELTLVRALRSGDTARVPVSVPIRRMRWMLESDQREVQQRQWTGRMVRVPVDALLQAESPCLWVDLPTNPTDQVHLGLRLVDIDGTELQRTDRTLLPAGQRRLHYDLGAFLDTIRTSPSPVLRIELEAQGLSKQEYLRWPVLSLTQSIMVENVQLEVVRIENRPVFKLRWNQPTRLRNRHVRFWPLWRPWDPVFEQPIPNDAEGVFTFDAPPERLRSGKYRLEFLVVDPWVPQVAEKPSIGSPGTVDVELISPETQLQYLHTRLQAKGLQFELLLERAVLYDDMGDQEKAKEDRQWCFEHLDAASPPHILTLVELASRLGDEATQKALQIKMFSHERVAYLLQAYKLKAISPDEFQSYFAHLPRPSLLPQKTCEYLLEIDDEAIRLQAAEALIQRSNARGIEAVLQWVEEAALSDADAVALLKRNSDLSAAFLQKRADHPLALRLLRTLSQDLGDSSPIVQTGTWVFCDAGWGLIKRIETRDGEPVEQFFRGQSDYRLHVTLRPGVEAEPVVVDLAQKEIRFPKAQDLFTCTKCYCFSTRDCHLIVNEHNRAAHGGIGPSFRPERPPKRILHTLEFRRKAPQNQLSGPLRSEPSQN